MDVVSVEWVEREWEWKMILQITSQRGFGGFGWDGKEGCLDLRSAHLLPREQVALVVDIGHNK